MHAKPHNPIPKRRRTHAPASHDGEATEAAAAPREQRLRAAAYALYLQRGSAPGHALQDWLQAEAMLDEQDRP